MAKLKISASVIFKALETREGIIKILVEHDDVAVIEIQRKSHRIEGPAIILSIRIN